MSGAAAGGKARALALVSTGLDSLLAARITQRLGIDILGVHFSFRFDPLREDPETTIARLYEPLDIPVRVIDVSDDFLGIVLKPEHGYGKGVNPCIDCKIFMYRRAKALMEETGARFLVTGEVPGQRPMSQMKPVLFHIEKEGGLRGLVVRPLGALGLPESIPEKEGWMDRGSLYGIQGRSRKEQLILAEKFGIRMYPQPAGGCILTDAQYAVRARILFRNRGRERIRTEDMQLLRLGRHFWPRPELHVIVGRDLKDNALLESLNAGYWLFEAAGIEGPLVLADGIQGEEDIRLVAGITARYIGKKHGGPYRIVFQGSGRSGEVEALRLDEGLVDSWRV
ncbi:tRNA 4-thiouridine(8) synthase ThiI [bacterium]|nr:tRNA 4-thiouridine(8) synthase ThiI [bacterium]